jgi:hypothetical protein
MPKFFEQLAAISVSGTPPRPARGRRVGLQPVAEALIGDVDHRIACPAFIRSITALPLRQVEVGAGRVVAAAMQQHHVARAPR